MKRACCAAVLAIFAGTIASCGRAPISKGPIAPASSAPEQPLLSVSTDSRPIPGMLDQQAAKGVAIGASPMQLVALGGALDTDRMGGFVNVRNDVCLLAFARGTPSIEDLDVVIFDDDGAELAADQSLDPRPVVLLCPPHPQRVYVMARVASGHGLVALGVQAIPADKRAAAAELGASISGQQAAHPQAWANLDAIIAERRRSLGGTWQEIRRVALPTSSLAPSVASAMLEANTCLDFFALPGEELGPLDVVATDDRGVEVGRAANIGKERAIVVCGDADSAITLSLRPHEGQGVTAVSIARSNIGANVELTLPAGAVRASALQPLKKVSGVLGSQLNAAGYGAPLVSKSGRLLTGRSTSVPVDLKTGCWRLDAVTGKPVAGVRASAWGNQQQLLGQSDGGEYSTIFLCIPDDERVTVELESIARDGDYQIQVRQEPICPSEFKASPLAAARLLERANAAGQVATAGQFSRIHMEEIGATHRLEVSMTVAENTCTGVVAALSPGAWGLQMHAYSSEQEHEVQGAYGTYSGGLRLCADHVPTTYRVFVSARSGQSRVLVAQYPLK